MIYKHEIEVIQSLYLVTIRGYKPKKILAKDDNGFEHDVTPIDPPGSANWFCNQYGMEYDQEHINNDSELIIWTDYDSDDDSFKVLMTVKGLEKLEDRTTELGYKVILKDSITEPCHLGDSGGYVSILKHTDGWVIAF